MSFDPGDVIRIYDGSIKPPDYKRFVVICPKAGWLLRINSKPHWKPNWLITAADNPDCLDHDSYLELHGIVDYLPSELEQAEFLGQLSDDTLEDLIDLLPSIETFNEEEVERMVECLNSAWN